MTTISTDNYINNVNYYQKKNVNNDKTEKADKKFEDYLGSDEFVKSDDFSFDFNTFFGKFISITKENLSRDEKVEKLSYKYKEIYDDINKDNLDENQKNEKLDSLNRMFKCSMNNILSNDAFIAKSNQIHDRLVADLNKYVFVNPDKEKHNNILKNDKMVNEYLNNLQETLINYADIYYEFFINDIKSNSVEKSIQNSFEKMRKTNLSMNYDKASDKAEELKWKKTELYKYIEHI